MHPSTPTASLSAEELCLVVHAPFGDDYALSRYPDGEAVDVLHTALVDSLRGVAQAGVAVVALIDLPGDATQLVTIDPGAPQSARAEPQWKMDMAAAPTLAGLLRAAARAFPARRLMLSIEGHGSGYQPAIDKAGLLALHEAGLVGDWHSSGTDQAPFDADGQPVYRQGVPTLPTGGPTLPTGGPTLPTGGPTLPTGGPTLPTGGPTLPTGGPTLPTGGPTLPTGGPTLPTGGPTLPTGGPTLPTGGPTLPTGGPTLPTGGPTLPTGGPTLPTGGPTLPTGGPTLPTGGPTLPVSHASMPTFLVGQALGQALAPGQKLVLIHFANCFNQSVELLHTVSPFAEAASGYCNTNFFTGAASYPAVFQRLAEGGRATAEELAAWFVQENHALLSQRGRHPIVGGSLSLSRMAGIARGIEALADALLAVMSETEHPRKVRRRIQAALMAAQQYDTSGDLRMDGPDQLTDLHSLAACMARDLADWPGVATAATRLATLLQGIKQVGDTDSPWMDADGEVVWNFEDDALAMNIFLPDPMRSGQWDWRTPFYVDINPGQGPGRLQAGVIDFLKETTWVEFIREYHRLTVFRSISVPGLFSVPTARRDVVRLPRERLERARMAGRQRPAPRPGPIAQRVARLLPKPDDIDD